MATEGATDGAPCGSSGGAATGERFLELPEYLSEADDSVHESDDEPEVIPPDIRLSPGDYVFGMDLHPTRNILVVGLSTGQDKMFVYDVDKCELQQEYTHHTDSIRDVAFTLDGLAYYSVGSDRRICGRDCETGQAFFDCTRSKHKCPVNKILMCTERNYVTGDDNGCILIWDCRQPKACAFIRHSEDQITDFDFDPGRGVVLASSLDRGYTVLDLRRMCDISYSRRLKKAELESIAIMAEGTQIVCGTSTGDLYTWDWGEWNMKPKGRIRGHREDLQCILPISNDHLLTGASDGTIRLLRLFPPELREYEFTVATIADHDNVVDFTIETIRVTPDDRWLAFTSHDYCIYWADLSGIQDKLYPPDKFLVNILKKAKKRRELKKKKLKEGASGKPGKVLLGQKRGRDSSGGAEGSEDEEEDEEDEDDQLEGKTAARGQGAKLAATRGLQDDSDASEVSCSDDSDDDDSDDDSGSDDDRGGDSDDSESKEYNFAGAPKADKRSAKEKGRKPPRKSRRQSTRLKHGLNCGKFNAVRREFFRDMSHK
eukprot:RCo028961